MDGLTDLLAIMAQDALKWGCWGGVGLLWSAAQHKCAKKRAGVCPRTSSTFEDGLPLFDGAQFDTTMVSRLHRDGMVLLDRRPPLGVTIVLLEQGTFLFFLLFTLISNFFHE